MIIYSDFSKTITWPLGVSTWSSVAKSWLLWSEYAQKRDQLYAENIGYEQAGNIEKTNAWFRNHATLMIEYGLSKVHIEQIVRSENYLPRDGFSSFIEKIRAKHIPLIIVTSGFTNFIEAWFQVHGFPTENITLYGNTFSFDQNWKTNGLVGISRTPLDKWTEVPLSSEESIYIGDGHRDLPPSIPTKHYTTYWFSDSAFMINLWTEGSFHDIQL